MGQNTDENWNGCNRGDGTMRAQIFRGMDDYSKHVNHVRPHMAPTQW